MQLLRECTRSLTFVIVMCWFGCTPVPASLITAERHLANARWEAAEQGLALVESELPHMSDPERVRYLWLRGVIAFQLQQHSDALHWCALARIQLTDHPELLPLAQRTKLDRMLDELLNNPRQSMIEETTSNSQ